MFKKSNNTKIDQHRKKITFTYKPIKFKKEKSSNIWKYIIIFITIAGIIGVSYTVFFSGIFNIQKIIIETEKKSVLNKDDVEVSVSNLLNKNLLFVSEDEISKTIKELYPIISDIIIKKYYPNIIRISLYDYQKVAVVIINEKGNFIINEQGTIIDTDISKGKDLLKIYIDSDIDPVMYKQIIKPSDLIFIFKNLKPINNLLGLTIKHVYYNNNSKELNFRLNNNWVLKFEINQNIEKALQELLLALEKTDKTNISEIDLRIPSKIFIKRKTEIPTKNTDTK